MIKEVNLSVFVYRLFQEDFSPTSRTNLDFHEEFLFSWWGGGGMLLNQQ